MQKIIRKRGGGKTWEAIRIANETGAYLVVLNRHQVSEYAKTTSKRPLTHAELLSGRLKGEPFAKVVIDEADSFLKRVISPLEVEAITMSPSEEALIPPGKDLTDRDQIHARFRAAFAAPQLLEACQAMVSFFDSLSFDPADDDHQSLKATADQCRAAIRAAMGETP